MFKIRLYVQCINLEEQAKYGLLARKRQLSKTAHAEQAKESKFNNHCCTLGHEFYDCSCWKPRAVVRVCLEQTILLN
jgi:hypothetical protein